MPERVAARLVTGPVAFLVGGLIDVLTFVVGSTRARRAARAGR
jgi:hypothetical protein